MATVNELLRKYYGVDDDAVLEPVIQELADLGMTDDELVNNFEGDEVANILAGYELGDSGDLMDPNMDESVETDVVDTTDGVDDVELDALKQAIEALSPEKRKELLDTFADTEDIDSIVDYTSQGDGSAASMSGDNIAGVPVDTRKNGNALAKLIGSLKF